MQNNKIQSFTEQKQKTMSKFLFLNSKFQILNSRFFFSRSARKAFTLLELLIVIGVTATMAVIGVGYYASISKSKLLNKTAEEITSYLKYAQQKSISQEQGLQWGVHFENPSSGSDFYALYTGTTYTTPVETKYLPQGIEFSTPQTASSTDISFNKLTGTTYSGTDQSIVIKSISLNTTTTISVFSQGLITH